MDYWKECVSEALCDAGIVASDEQIKSVAEFVEGAHDMYGEANGHHFIPNPVDEENKKLKRELEREKSKVICNECGGNGKDISHGPCHFRL